MSRADTGGPVEIAGLDFDSVPQSWIDHGADMPARGGDSRHYATLAAYDAQTNEVVVRYAHPTNDTVIVERFDALQRQDSNTVFPALLADDEKAWPRSVPHFWADRSHDATRLGEVALIPELHDLSGTAYAADSRVGPSIGGD